MQGAGGAAVDLTEEAELLKDERPGDDGEGQQHQENDAGNPAGLLEQIAERADEKKRCEDVNVRPPPRETLMPPKNYRSTGGGEGQGEAGSVVRFPLSEGNG